MRTIGKTIFAIMGVTTFLSMILFCFSKAFDVTFFKSICVAGVAILLFLIFRTILYWFLWSGNYLFCGDK